MTPDQVNGFFDFGEGFIEGTIGAALVALWLLSLLAAVCAFAVLVIKLLKSDNDVRWFRAQVLLLGLGATLYIVPYFLGVQVTQIGSDTTNQLASLLVSSHNVDVALWLCYLSAALVGILAAIAVGYNLRQASGHAHLDIQKESAR